MLVTALHNVVLRTTGDQRGVTEELEVLTDVPNQLIVIQDLVGQPIKLTIA